MCEGRPIPYISVKLVGDDGAEVAPGHVGHLLIRGDNVTRGYYQNPEANAAAITPDAGPDRTLLPGVDEQTMPPGAQVGMDPSVV
jgi:long-subunit acyl-CoA synthetase (AMP-forming)